MSADASSQTPISEHGNTQTTMRNPALRAKLKHVARILMRKNLLSRIVEKFASPENSELGLCTRCADLRLVPQDFLLSGTTDRRNFADILLGSFQGICVKAYGCALCRLIIKSLAEQPYSKLADIVSGQLSHSTRLDMNATCKAAWQVDGRTDVHKTRRLCIKWSDKCFEPVYLIMVGRRRTLPGGAVGFAPEFLARHFDPMNETYEMKLDKIGKWIDICLTKHGSNCNAIDNDGFRELTQTAFFGVIDVRDMCFKALPEHEKYVALSYNWGPGGDDGRYTTKLSTVLKIKKHNGLIQYHAELPRTIRETIQLVRDLRLRYLWIDSICIVQDSSNAWDRNADVMDLVYSNAFLTICAADGEDADAGLQVLSNPDGRALLCTESYSKELQLMARYPAMVHIQRSKWNTRAWTFQERLLSKRTLIFTNGRMYYQCSRTTMCEDIDMETPIVGSSLDFEGSPGEDSKRLDDDPVSAYTGNVGLYTARDLSKPKDVLAAFYGISKLRCNALGGDSLFGLPTSHFDWALLWEPDDAPQRRAEIELVGERRKPGKILPFPSWSWCGWDGRRIQYEPHMVEECSEHLHSWLMSHTWITWYIRDGNGNLRLVWNDVSRDNAAISDAQWRGYRANEKMTSPHDHYGRKLLKALVDLQRDTFDKTIPEFPVQVRTLQPGQTSSISLYRPDHPLLQFWTWSAYFYLEPLSRRQPGVAGDSRHVFSRRYDILDASRNWVGSIVFNPAWKFDIREPQQFIAISDARRFWRVEFPLDNNYSGSKTTWRLYNVILLTYDEENKKSRLIASRVGLGKIYHDAFEHACQPPSDPPRQTLPKSWEEIILG